MLMSIATTPMPMSPLPNVAQSCVRSIVHGKRRIHKVTPFSFRGVFERTSSGGLTGLDEIVFIAR